MARTLISIDTRTLGRESAIRLLEMTMSYARDRYEIDQIDAEGIPLSSVNRECRAAIEEFSKRGVGHRRTSLGNPTAADLELARQIAPWVMSLSLLSAGTEVMGVSDELSDIDVVFEDPSDWQEILQRIAPVVGEEVSFDSIELM